jgi:hypothetical protein
MSVLSGYLKIGSFIHMHPYAKRFRQTAAVVLALLEPEHHLGKEFGPLVTFEPNLLLVEADRIKACKPARIQLAIKCRHAAVCYGIIPPLKNWTTSSKKTIFQQLTCNSREIR